MHWIDAFDPTSDETRSLADVLGTRIPTRDDLVEIESSSRLSVNDGVILMSLPATVRDADGYPSMTPVGFVVTPDRVATLRFARLPSFENLAKEICSKGEVSAGGMGATITILEIIVDQVADLLERVGGELDAVSRSIFLNESLSGKTHTPRRSGDILHALLKNIGRHADLVSKVSETLLGLSRIPPFPRRQRLRDDVARPEDASSTSLPATSNRCTSSRSISPARRSSFSTRCSASPTSNRTTSSVC